MVDQIRTNPKLMYPVSVVSFMKLLGSSVAKGSVAAEAGLQALEPITKHISDD